jgi:hypothetical protein
MIRIMDEFEVDGLYNDMGYHRRSDILAWGKYYLPEPKVAEDEVLAFEESATYDGAVEDMLGLIYAEIKRRGGIYKLHKEGSDKVFTNLKVYDYLWVGEAVWDINFLRERVKNYDPYVIPELSRHYSLGNEEELYLNSIPYLQFPVFRTAQTGGAKEQRSLYKKWLALYQIITEGGTWAWIEIGDNTLLKMPLPQGVVASAFINREFFLVLANYSNNPVTIETVDQYTELNKHVASATHRWKLEARSLLLLQRQDGKQANNS